jgi:aminoglycoside phosphotransferase (APT) family kinase protein
MDSLTKVRVTEAELAAMVRRGFGAQARVTQLVELTEGTYNAAYRLRLADGQVFVLKVAPPPGMSLLTHEVDLMRTEAEFFQRAREAGAPVPAIAFADLDRELVGRDYMFLEELAGESLAQVDPQLSTVDRGAVRRELGAAIGRLHAVTGERYGYPLRDSRTWQPTWREAFLAMVEDILADAARLDSELPLPLPVIADRFARHAVLLDAVDRPALVHFDLWDGNVFVRRAGDGWRLTGLIDGERAFYGDQYAEFVSIALFRDIRELPEVLEGYAAATGGPVEFTEDDRLRITMYTCYLYLIMGIEGVTRGFDPVTHDPTRRRVLALLAELLEVLGR